jgi:cytochrome c
MRSVWMAVGVTGLALAALGWKPYDDAAQPVYYTTKVQPILQSNCYKCHGGDNHRGGLSMMTRSSLLTGGHHGPAIIPGDPAKSLLITLAKREGPEDDPMPMPPPPRQQLSSDQIATIETWIKAGAIMPDAPAAASPSKH